MRLRHLFMLLGLLTAMGCLSCGPLVQAVCANEPEPFDLTLAGQLKAIEMRLRDKMAKDPPLINQKLKFGKVVNENLPESSFEFRLESDLKQRLADLLSETSTLTLSASYDYLPAEEGQNAGHKVIQIVLTVKSAERRVLFKEVVEVNNTGDIARVLGQTLAPPDEVSFKKRNEAVEKAEAQPQFETHPDRRTAVTTVGKKLYAVEVRKQVGGKGAPVVTAPANQNGRAFVDVGIGDTYEVVLLNFDTEYDAVAKLEIDGLDTANTFSKDQVDYPGYLIPRAKNGQPGIHVVPGWLHTIQRGNGDKPTDNVFQFVVNELGKGAASAKQVRSEIGAINVRFFDAAAPGQPMRQRSFGETGKGQGMQVNYQLQPMQIGSQPLSIITVRYTRQPAADLPQ